MMVYQKEFSLHKLQITLGHEGGTTSGRWNITESCLEPPSLHQISQNICGIKKKVLFIFIVYNIKRSMPELCFNAIYTWQSA